MTAPHGSRSFIRLDDFLEPLSNGVWEVVIQKVQVTEPLDAGWRHSGINVPSPGTIASYRKGRYHAHETRTEWRVHLDRYDPEKNPLMHLADDAPLVLMISDTFMTLIMDSRRTEHLETGDLIRTQRFIWQEQVLSGIVLVFAGIFIVGDPIAVFEQIVGLVIPLAIIGLAILLSVRALSSGRTGTRRIPDLLRAAGIFCAGVLTFFLPLGLWVVAVLAVLAVWTIASAGILLARVMKGRSAVPEGFYSRIATGVLSLALAGLLFTSPGEILALLILILGAVTLLLGITVSINGLRLRSWMHRNASG